MLHSLPYFEQFVLFLRLEASSLAMLLGLDEELRKTLGPVDSVGRMEDVSEEVSVMLRMEDGVWALSNGGE